MIFLLYLIGRAAFYVFAGVATLFVAAFTLALAVVALLVSGMFRFAGWLWGSYA